MKMKIALMYFFLTLVIFVGIDARTCYECYDKTDCKNPSTIICPSDEYGCATAILDIEPFLTKGCLSDDKGPFKLNGCKRKTKNGVTGQLCGCMSGDLCNTECMDNGDCSLQVFQLSVDTNATDDQISKAIAVTLEEGPQPESNKTHKKKKEKQEKEDKTEKGKKDKKTEKNDENEKNNKNEKKDKNEAKKLAAKSASIESSESSEESQESKEETTTTQKSGELSTTTEMNKEEEDKDIEKNNEDPEDEQTTKSASAKLATTTKKPPMAAAPQSAQSKSMSTNMLPDSGQPPSGTMPGDQPKSSVQRSEHYFLGVLLIPVSWIVCFAIIN